MKALEFVAEVDKRHCLQIELPQSTIAGRVRVIVFVPEAEDEETGTLWMEGVAREWAAELADEREDIYTLEDGEPVNATR